jgi:hypothetical protein
MLQTSPYLVPIYLHRPSQLPPGSCFIHTNFCTPTTPQIMAAMAAYGTRPRTQWVCEWPAMVVLAAAQVFWSQGVEAAIKEGRVGVHLEKCTEELMGLTDLVRTRDR